VGCIFNAVGLIITREIPCIIFTGNINERGTEIAGSKERKQQEKKSGMSEEGTNPFEKSSRTGRSLSRSEEGNKNKKIDKEMKTMIREGTARIREENKVLRKELTAVREEMKGREEKWQAEKVDWMERMKMIEEKMREKE
jgi:hypothetical protein